MSTVYAKIALHKNAVIFISLQILHKTKCKHCIRTQLLICCNQVQPYNIAYNGNIVLYEVVRQSAR